MHLSVYSDAGSANAAAAEWLAEALSGAGVRNVMPAGGNTPLEMYGRIAGYGKGMGHLRVFMLDEYVGVPPDEARNCANLIRTTVVEPWGVPAAAFHRVSSVAEEALASVREHERRIADAGGLDLVVLGLGRNGHLGFNEPGSGEDSEGRIVELSAVSVEANREWFGGRYAPDRGVTVGLKTILAARRVLLLAYGEAKAAAVAGMVEGTPGPECPASYLQGHPRTRVFVDVAAAAGLRRLN